MALITRLDIHKHSKEIVGGKGHQLFQLINSGINVPKFVVVSSSEYFFWKKNNSLSPDLIKNLDTFFDQSDELYYAIRSSLSSEDGEQASFAGTMDSFLFITKEYAIESIIKCYRSATNSNMQIYDQDKKHCHMAVVIQVMIDSEVSGVAFSRDPSKKSNHICIDASYGLGEGVVSGLINIDSFKLNRFGELIEESIGFKDQEIKRLTSQDKETGLFTAPQSTPKEIQNESCLNSKELMSLYKAILTVEDLMQYPVDVEWGFYNHQLYVLQARPITTSFPRLNYYVDTNISESYPGITSPLSGSFINNLYCKVHVECAQLLGFKKEKMQRLLPSFKTMANYIGGHMYYNIESYYQTLLSIPGGKSNLKNWHQMIGGNIESIPIKYQPEIISFRDKLNYYYFILKLLIFHKSIFTKIFKVNKLLKSNLYKKLKNSTHSQKTIKLLEVGIDSIKGFGYIGFNDLIIMMMTSKIAALLDKYQVDQTLIKNLIKTKQGVESLIPLQEMDKICSMVKDRSTLVKLINQSLNQTDKYDLFYNLLDLNNFNEIKIEIIKYLQNFGNRSFEELKLESLTFNQSSKEFLTLLKWKLSNPSIIRCKECKNISDFKMSFIDTISFNFFLKYARNSIEVREKGRLIRGEFYGWARDLLLQANDQINKEGKLKISREEFFSLKLNNLFKYSRGDLSIDDLKSISLENALWTTLEGDHFKEMICLEEGTCFEKFQFEFEVEKKVLIKKNQLIGLGASNGETLGSPLILSDPRKAMEIEDLSKYILVTKNTDPAWIFIMSKCAGLISEKGSLLSHTAIIGRELGIPTIVGIKNITKTLTEDMLIKLNGKTGVITILNKDKDENH